MGKKMKINNMEREFDYYVYVDYSESLAGYIVTQENKIKEILPKTSRLRHYKEIKYVIEFIKKNNNKRIFLSIDDNQYYSFMRLLEIMQKRDYSLIIDTMLNIGRKLGRLNCDKEGGK